MKKQADCQGYRLAFFYMIMERNGTFLTGPKMMVLCLFPVSLEYPSVTKKDTSVKLWGKGLSPSKLQTIRSPRLN